VLKWNLDFLGERTLCVELTANGDRNTGDENDDLLVGFKGLMNDYYARDGGRKVRTGYRQKQKEGLIMTPPFGYFKDKNTKEVVIVEEAAETVRLIFKLYVDGHGFKAVARILNEKGCQTPAYFQKKLLNKNVPCTWPSISKQGIWINTTVKRILKDEIYTGTLINHKSETNNINKTFKFTTPEEQYRHENFVPPIISRELWEQAQFLIKDRPERNVRSKADQKIHRYTGLIFCRTCGSRFTARNRKWKESIYVEYICTSYHRYGKEYCSPHLVREETLDKLIYEELESIKWMAQENWRNIERQVRDWASQKGNVERKIAGLNDKIAGLESEIEQILMERIHDKANAERYNKMIEKRELEIAQSRERIENYQNIEATVQKRKAGMKHSIDLLDEIVANGGISDTHLRMLIDGVYVDEIDGKLEIEICLKADFMPHYDEYGELGELAEKYSDLGFAARKYNRTMYAKGVSLVKSEAV